MWAEKQQRISDTIPYVELDHCHVRNTRTLTDREALLAAMPKGGIVAEVGVDQGDFSEKIFSICGPRQFHLIDAWDSDRYNSAREATVRAKFADEIRLNTVQIHKGFSTAVLASIDDDYFDFIYIDTSHDYVTTAAELALAKDKVKPRGIIAGHDYITGRWIGQVRYGVIEAVHEFCVRNNWELLFLTAETHQHRSFAIRKIGDE
jgi:hypothetical protein